MRGSQMFPRSPNWKNAHPLQVSSRRMVMEGRMGYWDLLVRLNGAEARWGDP